MKKSKDKDKWIVFDIDGTLSITVDPEEYWEIDASFKGHFDKITYRPLEKHPDTKSVWVMKRPYIDCLFNYVFKHYKVGVWSMGQPDYVNTMVKHLFGSYQPDFIYNFTNCTREYNPIRLYKPLSDSPASGGYIVDDQPNVTDPSDNSVIVPTFDISITEEGEVDQSHLRELIQDTAILDLIKLLRNI
jgi:hypothetical protein